MIAARPAPLRLLSLAFVLSIAALGCSLKHGPSTPAPVVDTGPVPDTPEHAVQLFQWSWQHRDVAAAERMFADDFTFGYGTADSIHEVPILRDDQLQIEGNMFVSGTATQPRASKIELAYNSSLAPLPDDRPGKTFPWHQQITLNVNLRFQTPDANYVISGYLKFHIVRADSAVIPADLAARGATPRADRWYVERIEDSTGASAIAVRTPTVRAIRPLDTLPTHRQTWGALESLYR